MEPVPASIVLERLRSEVERSMPAFLGDLERLVSIESGTYTKVGVDTVSTWMAERLEALGATIERRPHPEHGDTVVATFQGHSTGPTAMLVGHADTVFEPGHLARSPYTVDGDLIHGPGVGDMKGGLLLGLYAIAALRAIADTEPWLPVGRLVYAISADEEIGSPTSAPIIAAHARDADAAFVLEPARANGDIVSARKGMVHIRATISGRAAHAGVAPHEGRSSVLEAAHKTIALHDLDGHWDGVSVNVGHVRGGTRPNIVPDEAVMLIDMRAATRETQDEAEAAIHQVLASSTVPDTVTSVETTAHHRPMEKTAASAVLVDQAVTIAAALGSAIGDAATGGCSDANTTAGLGVPSIDGLGPVAMDQHTSAERIVADSIVPRTCLLAALIMAQTRVEGGS